MDQGIGRASLALAGLGSLCALAYVLSVVDPNRNWPEAALFIGSAGSSFVGFFVGFVGWYSWEDKASIGLVVFGPPFWLAVGFLVAVAYGP